MRGLVVNNKWCLNYQLLKIAIEVDDLTFSTNENTGMVTTDQSEAWKWSNRWPWRDDGLKMFVKGLTRCHHYDTGLNNATFMSLSYPCVNWYKFVILQKCCHSVTGHHCDSVQILSILSWNLLKRGMVEA